MPTLQSNITNKYVLLSGKYKALLLLSITIAIIVALSLTIGRVMFGQVMLVRAEINSLSQSTKTLTQKLEILSQYDLDLARKQAQSAVNAVPSDTPSLPILLSLRTIAANHGVAINDFQVSEKSETKQSTQKSLNIQLSVSGELTSVLQFLDQIKNYPPLMRVTAAQITVSGTSALTRVQISSSWGPLPQSLGKRDSPLDPFKSTELEALEQLSKFDQTSSSGFLPTPGEGKANPFR